MLCQLVCIDRRYQRMNCFNIRELQGILKRKFFTDLVNTSDFHAMLDDSSLAVRFKSSDLNTYIDSNTELFYSFGTTTSSKDKNLVYESMYSTVIGERHFLSVGSYQYVLVE